MSSAVVLNGSFKDDAILGNASQQWLQSTIRGVRTHGIMTFRNDGSHVRPQQSMRWNRTAEFVSAEQTVVAVRDQFRAAHSLDHAVMCVARNSSLLGVGYVSGKRLLKIRTSETLRGDES
ncbi:MAG: hypothetical protein U0936_10240 [Planctomycetaceae bacterium]